MTGEDGNPFGVPLDSGEEEEDGDVSDMTDDHDDGDDSPRRLDNPAWKDRMQPGDHSAEDDDTQESREESEEVEEVEEAEESEESEGIDMHEEVEEAIDHIRSFDPENIAVMSVVIRTKEDRPSPDGGIQGLKWRVADDTWGGDPNPLDVMERLLRYNATMEALKFDTDLSERHDARKSEVADLLDL